MAQIRIRNKKRVGTCSKFEKFERNFVIGKTSTKKLSGHLSSNSPSNETEKFKIGRSLSQKRNVYPKFEKFGTGIKTSFFAINNSFTKENEYFIPSYQALIQNKNLQTRNTLETFRQNKERVFSSFSQV